MINKNERKFIQTAYPTSLYQLNPNMVTPHKEKNFICREKWKKEKFQCYNPQLPSYCCYARVKQIISHTHTRGYNIHRNFTRFKFAALHSSLYDDNHIWNHRLPGASYWEPVIHIVRSTLMLVVLTNRWYTSPDVVFLGSCQLANGHQLTSGSFGCTTVKLLCLQHTTFKWFGNITLFVGVNPGDNGFEVDGVVCGRRQMHRLLRSFTWCCISS